MEVYIKKLTMLRFLHLNFQRRKIFETFRKSFLKVSGYRNLYNIITLEVEEVLRGLHYQLNNVQGN